MKDRRTTGVMMLQVKRPEQLVGVVSAGVDERGSPHVRFLFYPKAEQLWLHETRLTVRYALAVDLVAAVHILAESAKWLDGFRPDEDATSPRTPPIAVRPLGTARNRTLECDLGAPGHSWSRSTATASAPCNCRWRRRSACARG